MDQRAFYRRNTKYTVLNGFFWMAVCPISSFAGFFLLSSSCSNPEIGLVLAISGVTTILAQLLTARLADRAKKVSPDVFISALTAAAILVCLGLLLARNHKDLLCGLYILLLTLCNALQPLVSGYAFYLERLQTPIVYGLARGVGSVTYSLMAGALGKISAQLGAPAVPAASMIFFAPMLAVLYLLRLEGRPAESTARAKLIRPAAAPRAGRSLVLLAGIGTLFFGVGICNNFLIQIVQAFHGSVESFGTLSMFGSFACALGVFLYIWVKQKLSCAKILCISSAVFFLQIALRYCAPSLGWLYAIAVLSVFSDGWIYTSLVDLANELMPAEYCVRSQARMTVAMTVGGILACALGGVMLDRLSIRGTLLAASCLTLAGLFLIVLGLKAARPVRAA